jgi:hypothetical protein
VTGRRNIDGDQGQGGERNMQEDKASVGYLYPDDDPSLLDAVHRLTLISVR